MKKKSASRRRDYIWSIIFLSLTLLLNANFAYISYTNYMPNFWPGLAAISSALALILLIVEKKSNELGKGKFLWSIFFAGLTLGVNIYIVSIFMTLWPTVAFLFASGALILLVKEKYIK